MTKIILQGYILVPVSDLDLVKAELENHKHLTLEESGCITFRVTENPENPCRFDVYEEFVDKAAFEAHQARVRASYWGEVSKNVERFYDVSE